MEHPHAHNHHQNVIELSTKWKEQTEVCTTELWVVSTKCAQTFLSNMWPWEYPAGMHTQLHWSVHQCPFFVFLCDSFIQKLFTNYSERRHEPSTTYRTETTREPPYSMARAIGATAWFICRWHYLCCPSAEITRHMDQPFQWPHWRGLLHVIRSTSSRQSRRGNMWLL